MEKHNGGLSQRIVLYTNYVNFQFSYLHIFYKANKIKAKPSTKVNLFSNLAQFSSFRPT